MAFKKIMSKLMPTKEGESSVVLGRNEPCRCGSGKKYKKCHLASDEEAERKRLEKAEIPPLPVEEKKEGDKHHDQHDGCEHPGHSHEKSGGFMRSIFNRKTG